MTLDPAEAPGLDAAARYIFGLVYMAPAWGWGEMSTDDVLRWVATQLEESAMSARVAGMFPPGSSTL